MTVCSKNYGRPTLKLLIAVLFVSLASPAGAVARCNPPSSGGRVAVSTPEAAVAAAKDAWDSIAAKATWHDTYKRENRARFEPYRATLTNGVWHVVGRIPADFHGRSPKALVCESDGSVEAEESIQ